MGTSSTRRKATRAADRSADRAAGLAPIEPGTLYPLADFQRRTGWGRHAVRTARGDGLKIHRAGGRAYALGQDFISFVTAGPEDRDGV